MIFLSHNGTNSLVDSEGLTTLHDAIHRVEAYHLPKGYVVGNVAFDGRPLDADPEQGWPNVGIEQIAEVTLFSQKPEEIAQEGMRQTTALVGDVIMVMRGVSLAFRDGRVDFAQSELVRGLGGMDTFIRFLAMSRPHFVGSLDLFRDFEGALLLVLNDMFEMQQNQQWNSLSDQIDEELIPQLERWSEVSRKILQAAELN